MPPKKQDKFDQFMVFSITMSAANTLTFSTIALGMSLFQYAALVVSRIEYSVGRPTLIEMNDEVDFIELAITGSNTITSLPLSYPEVYDRISYNVTHGGTPASQQIIEKPIVKDFTGMKGGGLLVPAQDIYVGMYTEGLASAGTAGVRLYYTIQEMQASDYIELVQRLRVLST